MAQDAKKKFLWSVQSDIVALFTNVTVRAWGICRFRRSHERRGNGGLGCLDDRHRQIDVREPRLVDVLAATGREVIEDAR